MRRGEFEIGIQVIDREFIRAVEFRIPKRKIQNKQGPENLFNLRSS